MKTIVIIAERNEPDLKATIANIKAAGYPVKVFSDTAGIGPQAARDRLICDAVGYDHCIIMDGHMRVKPETIPWAAAFLRSRPDTVSCAQCFHSPVESFQGKPYNGARLDAIGIGKDASEPQAFVAKWRKSETTGPIGAVMGAFYSFRRDWYMDGLRRPWQFGTGWGCDEEIISAATWLRGGSVHLLPVPVWHRARGPAEVPYKLTDEQLFGVFANRLRILYMMPMPADERQVMYRHIAPQLTAAQWKKVASIAKCDDVAVYREFLAAGPMKWPEFMVEIMDNEEVEMAREKHNRNEPADAPKKRGRPSKAATEKARKIAEAEIAKAASQPPPAIESRIASAIAPPAQLANWGAAETPRACPHCHQSSAIVYSTHRDPRHIRRYRTCNHCGRNFVTREVIAK